MSAAFRCLFKHVFLNQNLLVNTKVEVYKAMSKDSSCNIMPVELLLVYTWIYCTYQCCTKSSKTGKHKVTGIFVLIAAKLKYYWHC